MPKFTYFDLIVTILLTSIIVLTTINQQTHNKIKISSENNTLLNKQFSIMIIFYCLYSLFTLFILTNPTYQYITLSFLFILYPYIYQNQMELKHIDLNNKQPLLYFVIPYILAVITLILVFAEDFYENIFAGLEITLTTLFSCIFIFQTILFLKNNLFSRFQNKIQKLMMFLLYITTLFFIVNNLYLNSIVINKYTFLTFIILLTYYCFNNTLSYLIQAKDKVLSNYPKIEDNLDTQITNNTKYSKSRIDIEKLTRIEENLSIINDDFYYDPCLDLKKLANTLNVSPYEMSYFFSTNLNVNFNQFVNKKRVIEAKRLLIDKSYTNIAIKDIGIEVGFSSASSFYRAFKENFNITPSQWRESNS